MQIFVQHPFPFESMLSLYFANSSGFSSFVRQFRTQFCILIASGVQKGTDLRLSLPFGESNSIMFAFPTTSLCFCSDATNRGMFGEWRDLKLHSIGGMVGLGWWRGVVSCRVVLLGSIVSIGCFNAIEWMNESFVIFEEEWNRIQFQRCSLLVSILKYPFRISNFKFQFQFETHWLRSQSLLNLLECLNEPAFIGIDFTCSSAEKLLCKTVNRL